MLPQEAPHTNVGAGRKSKHPSNPSTPTLASGNQDEPLPPLRRHYGLEIQVSIRQPRCTQQSWCFQGIQPLERYLPASGPMIPPPQDDASFPVPSSSGLKRATARVSRHRRQPPTGRWLCAHGRCVTRSWSEGAAAAPPPRERRAVCSCKWGRTNRFLCMNTGAGLPYSLAGSQDITEACTAIASEYPAAPGSSKSLQSSHIRLLYIRDEHVVVLRTPVHQTDSTPLD